MPGADHSEEQDHVYTISGTVLSTLSTTVAGVTITTPDGMTAVTDSSGVYHLIGLAAGEYTLTPSKSEFSFEPPSRTVTVGPVQVGLISGPLRIAYWVSGVVKDNLKVGIPSFSARDRF